MEFHLHAIREMLRVAREVRVFPLLILGGAISPYLSFAMKQLVADGLSPEIKPVPYEFQRGGNEMLVIRNS